MLKALIKIIPLTLVLLSIVLMESAAEVKANKRLIQAWQNGPSRDSANSGNYGGTGGGNYSTGLNSSDPSTRTRAGHRYIDLGRVVNATSNEYRVEFEADHEMYVEVSMSPEGPWTKVLGDNRITMGITQQDWVLNFAGKGISQFRYVKLSPTPKSSPSMSGNSWSFKFKMFANPVGVISFTSNGPTKGLSSWGNYGGNGGGNWPEGVLQSTSSNPWQSWPDNTNLLAAIRNIDLGRNYNMADYEIYYRTSGYGNSTRLSVGTTSTASTAVITKYRATGDNEHHVWRALDLQGSFPQVRYISVGDSIQNAIFYYFEVKLVPKTRAPANPVITSPSGNPWLTISNPTVTWNYSDPDGDPQGGYQLQRSTVSNFSSIAYDSGQVSSSNKSAVIPANSHQGNQWVRLRVRDPIGVWSGWSSAVQYRVDTTKPTNPTINANPSSNWSNTNVSVTLTNGTDSGSGVKHSQYRLTGATSAGWINYSPAITVSNQGETTVYARTVDNAGNISGEVSRVVRVDKTAPTAPAITLSNSNWTSDNVSFTISGSSDGHSGIARREYMLSGATTRGWTTYTGIVTISNEGSTTISARAIDNVGNISSVATAVARIDRLTAPDQLSPGSLSSEASAIPIIPNTNPTLTWRFKHAGTGTQSSYQVIISSTSGAVVHDSGRVTSTASSYAVPTGVLQSGGTFQWKARTWDNHGEVTPYSSVVFFNIYKNDFEYRYDSNNRLDSVWYKPLNLKAIEYRYDNNGNLVKTINLLGM